MKHLVILAAAVLLLFSSCTKDRITGSGPITTESRNVANFTSVSTSGSTNVRITQGANFSVQVKGYTNLLPYFDTKVSNNRLELGFRNNINVKNDNIEVFITMPALEGASINGSAGIDIKGVFVSNRIDLSIAGSGDINIEAGTTPIFTSDISGSGSIRAFGVTADRADISISGSGTTETKVVTHLKANIAGSGNIYYKGTPTIESSVSGSGKLVHRP